MRITRRDHARRMARFYRLALQPSLLDACDLVREWGRIGSPGQVRAEHFPTEAEAAAALARRAEQKRRRGYA